MKALSVFLALGFASSAFAATSGSNITYTPDGYVVSIGKPAAPSFDESKTAVKAPGSKLMQQNDAKADAPKVNPGMVKTSAENSKEII